MFIDLQSEGAEMVEKSVAYNWHIDNICDVSDQSL